MDKASKDERPKSNPILNFVRATLLDISSQSLKEEKSLSAKINANIAPMLRVCGLIRRETMMTKKKVGSRVLTGMKENCSFIQKRVPPTVMISVAEMMRAGIEVTSND